MRIVFTLELRSVLGPLLSLIWVPLARSHGQNVPVYAIKPMIFEGAPGGQKVVQKMALGDLWGSSGSPLGSFLVPFGPSLGRLGPRLVSERGPCAPSVAPRVHVATSFASRVPLGTHFASQRPPLDTILGANGSQKAARRAPSTEFRATNNAAPKQTQRPHHRTDQWTRNPTNPARRNARSD